MGSVEMPPEALEEGAGHRKSSARGAAGVVFQEGQQVVLTGLDDETLNGKLGIVIKAKPDRERYEVDVSNGENEGDATEKIKGVQHLVAVVKDGKCAYGTSVAIRSLRSHPELNGCLARIVECHEEKGRYEVRSLSSSQLFRVKQDNLIVIEEHKELGFELPPKECPKENQEPNVRKPMTPRGKSNEKSSANILGDDIFAPGTKVQLCNLKSAAQYNGQSAEVVSVDKARGRYEIRMSDGSLKTVKADNVNSSSSPLAGPNLEVHE